VQRADRREAKKMWLVVGLGNPGREYESSRHNVGFMVVDVLARRARAAAFASKFKGEVATATLGGESVLLLKPSTFMNLSGQSVQPAMQFYKITPDHIVAVHDDMDLELGQIKLKRGGGAGGHNGIKSIDSQIGPDYFRVRGGIGHARSEGRQVVGHVLGNFKGKDAQDAAILVENCADAIEMLIKDGLEKAQLRFHSLKPS
jgi:PTH1 family peptidyl-tRNA hydrolase